jgi:hypothetical protein
MRRSHPAVFGTLEMCLGRRVIKVPFQSSRNCTHLKTNGLSRLAKRDRMLEFMVWMNV